MIQKIHPPLQKECLTPKYNFFHPTDGDILTARQFDDAIMIKYAARVSVWPSDAHHIASVIFRLPLDVARILSKDWRFTYFHPRTMSVPASEMTARMYCMTHAFMERLRIANIVAELTCIQRVRVVKEWVKRNEQHVWNGEMSLALFMTKMCMVMACLGLYPIDVVDTIVYDYCRKGVGLQSYDSDMIGMVTGADKHASINWGKKCSLAEIVLFALDELAWYSANERMSKDAKPDGRDSTQLSLLPGSRDPDGSGEQEKGDANYAVK